MSVILRTKDFESDLRIKISDTKLVARRLDVSLLYCQMQSVTKFTSIKLLTFKRSSQNATPSVGNE